MGHLVSALAVYSAYGEWEIYLSLDEQVVEEGKLFANRYKLQKVLGRGGMGSVYLAIDTMLGDETIALKVLHSELGQNEKHTKRFLREVQLTRRVTHPNVVRTFDAGNEKGRLFFTMEYAEGDTLKERIRNGPLDPKEAAQIVREICKGLYAIHEADIIHRDLKPGNVIITPTGFVKITDFGVAKPGGSDLTGHNEVIGSIPYMSPEVWVGRDIGRGADIYALGVLTFEMLTGSPPFEGDSPAELMCKHLEAKPTAPRDLRPEVPEWLSDLVMRMLEKDQLRRPRAVDEIVQTINFQLDGIGEAPTPRSHQLGDAPAGYEVPSPRHESSAFDVLLEQPPSLDDVVSDGGTAKFVLAPSRALLGITKVLAVETEAQDAAPSVRRKESIVSTFIVLAFCISFVYLSFAVYRHVADAWWQKAADDGGMGLVVGVLASVTFLYGLILAIPMLVLCSFVRSVSVALFGWVKLALIYTALTMVLYGVNLMRLEAKSYELKMGYEKGRFFSTAQATLTNMTEAALLIPSGTNYHVAIKFHYPVLVGADNAPLVDRVPYFCLLLAYIVTFVRLSERWVFRRLKRRWSFLVLGVSVVGLLPIGAELVLFGICSKYLEIYSLKNHEVVFGPVTHSFSLISLCTAAVNWGILLAATIFFLPWLLRRLGRSPE